MTARRFPDYEPYRPPSMSDLPLFASTPGEAARDRILSAFEAHKAAIVRALRDEAWQLWEDRHEPLSANDVRPVLARLGYDGDHRILVAAFPKDDWMPVGFTKHGAPGNHARRILTFVPRNTE